MALDTTNWDGMCGTPWQIVALELTSTKKVKSDKEGAGPQLPKIVVERYPEVEPRRFCMLSADIEAHGHTGGCSGCTVDRGGADVPMEHGSEEQMADRHAVASGEDE